MTRWFDPQPVPELDLWGNLIRPEDQQGEGGRAARQDDQVRMPTDFTPAGDDFTPAAGDDRPRYSRRGYLLPSRINIQQIFIWPAYRQAPYWRICPYAGCVAVARHDHQFCPRCGRPLPEDPMRLWPVRFRLENTRAILLGKLRSLRAVQRDAGDEEELEDWAGKLAEHLWSPPWRPKHFDPRLAECFLRHWNAVVEHIAMPYQRAPHALRPPLSRAAERAGG